MLLGGDKINGSIILLISEPHPMFGKVILCVCTSTKLESTYYGKQRLFIKIIMEYVTKDLIYIKKKKDQFKNGTAQFKGRLPVHVASSLMKGLITAFRTQGRGALRSPAPPPPPSQNFPYTEICEFIYTGVGHHSRTFVSSFKIKNKRPNIEQYEVFHAWIT